MQVNITFYNFKKRTNTNEMPTTGGKLYRCIFKSGSDITAPFIQLRLANVGEVPTWNYAYIEEFNRYYYVGSWSLDSNTVTWTSQLAIDVLTSWNAEIKQSSAFIERTSKIYAYQTGYYSDDSYPQRSDSTSVKHVYNYPWYRNGEFNAETQGYYVVGVIGLQSTKTWRAGSVSYIVMPFHSVVTMITDLMSYVDSTSMSGVPDSIAKSLANPMQYIASCVYIPFFGQLGNAIGDAVTGLKFYTYSLTDVTWFPINTDAPMLTDVVSIPWEDYHPQAGGSGTTFDRPYYNLSPYTTRMLYIPLFGTYELDTVKLGEPTDGTMVNITFSLDLPTGQGRVSIDAPNGAHLADTTALIGVPTQLSQSTQSVLTAKNYEIQATAGVAGNIMTGLASVVGGAATGDILGAVGGAMSSVMNSVAATQTSANNIKQAMTPVITSTGANGCLLGLFGKIEVSTTFIQTSDAYDVYGYICKEWKPLSDFTEGQLVVIRSGSLKLPETCSIPLNEYNMLNDLLSRGAYIS